MQKIKDWFKKVFTKENMIKVGKWITGIVLVFGIIQVILKLFRDIGSIQNKLEEKEIPLPTYPEKKKDSEIIDKQIIKDKKEVEKQVEKNEEIVKKVDEDQKKVYINEKEREELEATLFK